jgi:Flp pilus assembly pilin Flp
MKDCFGTIGAWVRAFWRGNHGQNLLEHSLLLAFVALASATLFMGAGKKVNTVWTVTNSTLTNAATAANQVS